MSFPLLMASALLALGSDPDPARVEAGLHVAQRARYLSFSGGVEDALSQSEVDPDLMLRVPGELAFHLGYSPRLYVPVAIYAPPGTVSSVRPVVLNQADAGLEQTRGLWRASVGVTGSLGQTDPLTARFMSGLAVPDTSPVNYHSAEVRTGLSGRPNRRTTVDLAASAYYSGSSGSSGPAGPTALPDQRGIHAGVRVGRNTSAADVLHAELSGQWASTDGLTAGADRTDGFFARAGGGIEHALWRHGSVGAAAGIAAEYTLPGGGNGSQAYSGYSSFPWALLSASWTEPGMHPSFTLALSMEPTIDRLSGLVDVAGSARASVDIHPERWTVGVAVTSSVFQPWKSFDKLSVVKGARNLVTTSTLRASHPVAQNVDAGLWTEVQLQHYVPGAGMGNIPSFSGVAAGLEMGLQLR